MQNQYFIKTKTSKLIIDTRTKHSNTRKKQRNEHAKIYLHIYV